MIRRGEIWWAALPDPRGSEPGFRRPVLIVQSDDFNRSGIATILTVILTSNTGLGDAPGNVLLSRGTTKLTKDSVANVSSIYTVDRSYLRKRVSKLPAPEMARVSAGLRLAMALE